MYGFDIQWMDRSGPHLNSKTSPKSYLEEFPQIVHFNWNQLGFPFPLLQMSVTLSLLCPSFPLKSTLILFMSPLLFCNSPERVCFEFSGLPNSAVGFFQSSATWFKLPRKLWIAGRFQDTLTPNRSHTLYWTLERPFLVFLAQDNWNNQIMYLVGIASEHICFLNLEKI